MGHSLLNGLETVHGKQKCCIEKEKPPRHCAMAALTRQLAKSTRHETINMQRGQYHGCKKNQA